MKRRKRKGILPLCYGFSGLALITITSILLGIAHHKDMKDRYFKDTYQLKR